MDLVDREVQEVLVDQRDLADQGVLLYPLVQVSLEIQVDRVVRMALVVQMVLVVLLVQGDH